jgi:hypothetical protein
MLINSDSCKLLQLEFGDQKQKKQPITELLFVPRAGLEPARPLRVTGF